METVIEVGEEVMPQGYGRPEARAVLAARDVGGVYWLLQRDGVPQREIARSTGQSQSEVSEILRGHQVRDVTVLERIVDGLGVPRAFMCLWGGTDGAYPVAVLARSQRFHGNGRSGCESRPLRVVAQSVEPRFME